MSRDITEYIDEYVYDNFGHTNWGYTGTYSLKERADKTQYELELNDSIIVWYEGIEEEE